MFKNYFPFLPAALTASWQKSGKQRVKVDKINGYLHLTSRKKDTLC